MKRFSATVDSAISGPVYHVPGEALVKVKTGMSPALANKLFELGLTIHKQMSLLAGEFIVVECADKSINSLIALLKGMKEVEYAEPNYTNRAPDYSKLSSEVAGSPAPQNPWEKFVVKEAAIEVIDSRIDLKSLKIQPDIQVNRKKIPAIRSGDYVEDITIKDLLFLSNKQPINLAEAVEAIDYATKMKVNILSNSWVKDGFSKALDDDLNVADKRGLSFVAAASIAATIGSSMGTISKFNPSYYYNLSKTTEDTLISQSELEPSVHVSAGVLSLYIAQEGNIGKTGRGRLIAKSAPSDEEIEHEWSSNSLDHSNPLTAIQSDFRITQNYSFPGAKFIKLEIEKLDQCLTIDLIVLRYANGLIIGNISGSGSIFQNDYIETNLITVEFTSNITSTSIGSVIRNVKIIYYFFSAKQGSL